MRGLRPWIGRLAKQAGGESRVEFDAAHRLASSAA
tara:strand:+ start:969 stop:1073 length:105 start_codon:yes stop_codon:yes gene_type:complete